MSVGPLRATDVPGPVGVGNVIPRTKHRRDPLHPWIILATVPGGNDDLSVTADAGAFIDRFADLDVTLKGGDGNDNLQYQFQGETDAVHHKPMAPGRIHA